METFILVQVLNPYPWMRHASILLSAHYPFMQDVHRMMPDQDPVKLLMADPGIVLGLVST